MVQLAARLTLNQKVPGSNPGGPVAIPYFSSSYDTSDFGAIERKSRRYMGAILGCGIGVPYRCIRGSETVITGFDFLGWTGTCDRSLFAHRAHFWSATEKIVAKVCAEYA